MSAQRSNGLRRPGFLELWSWIHQSTGIAFAEGQLEGLARRIDRRMVNLSIGRYDDYLHLLIESGQTGEFDHLVDGLTTRDTHFYREPEHLKRTVSLVAHRMTASAERVRVWCAGCATGEEPYSLAMLISSELGPEALERVEVVATDISRAALNAAEQARYPESAIRYLPREHQTSHFKRESEEWRVSGAIQPSRSNT
jgi:chemotaxis methyl-accepting protein methylase